MSIASLAGKLDLIIKIMVNLEVIAEDPVGSGNYYIINYDDDNTTEIRKCLLKDIEDNPFVFPADSTEVAIREKTSVTPAPTVLSGSLREKTDKIMKALFNHFTIVESPTGSGKYYRVLYDDDGRAILAKMHLKDFRGREIRSLRNSTTASQRLKSEV